MDTSATREEFASARRKRQTEVEQELIGTVRDALSVRRFTAALTEAISSLYRTLYAEDAGTSPPASDTRLAKALRELRASFADTTADTEPATVALQIATVLLNVAASAAAEDDESDLGLEWVTMHDSHVRPAHAETDGQVRPVGEDFDVAGVKMPYPGWPAAPISSWINCRCVLRPTRLNENSMQAPGVAMSDSGTGEGEGMDDNTAEMTAIPWHGVLAPEGVWSGDGRRFAPDSLSHRDLPMPLTWQKVSEDGHNGNVTVAKITHVGKVDGQMRGAGTMLLTPEADELVGLLAEFGRFGVSVDADSAEFEFDEDAGNMTFTKARVSSACVVAIPAFAEAYVTLGEPPEGFLGENPSTSIDAPQFSYEQESFAISEKPWNGSASRFTIEQWRRSCILDMGTGDKESKSRYKLPIKEPNGDLSRAGVHAAASRIGSVDAPAAAIAKAKSALRSAYSTLGEDAPDMSASVAASITADRGPGWLTNPEDTRRLHDYWTVPGHAGYEKVNWGVPGDFYRCRAEVGEEIGESSPEKLRFINQLCAQWHHDALGFWPGRPTSGQTYDFSADGFEAAPAVSLVAAAAKAAPASWFADPEFTKTTHLTVTAEGRVFGHIAQWGTCHIGHTGVCVTPPTSTNSYAYFATGQVLLDDGTLARTGPLTVGTGHADPALRWKAALAHYDNTGAAVADVAVGEDRFGIWCAGWVRPGASEEQVIALRASDISGDWRRIGTDLEMVAALAVNSAGFPISVAASAGQQDSLVAAGVVAEPETSELIDVARLAAAEVLKALRRKERMDALRNREASHAV